MIYILSNKKQAANKPAWAADRQLMRIFIFQ